ncbi:hypothetical protein SLA2020_128030 [Shorea laevis]
MLGFSRHINYTTGLAGELWAIRDGPDHYNRGFTRLILESESMTAKALIDNANCEFPSVGSLVSNCRMLLLGQVLKLQFNHIFREANSAANHLAKTRSQVRPSFCCT